MSRNTAPAPPARWPRPLLPGGTIGIGSPAGPSSAEATARAVHAFEERGYRVVVAEHTHSRSLDYPYLAGTEDERLADLNSLIRNPDIDLILCARGGYGSGKLLDRVDFDALRADPKPLVGYSDITALSLGILACAGVVTFSGIMANAGHGFGQDTLDPWSEASFWQAVGPSPFPRVMTRPEDDQPWAVLRGPAGGGTTVTGPVIPVCLSLLTSVWGTPYAPDLTGAILVIEDIHEELYGVDRCLTQLRLSGALDRLAALLVGSFNGLSPEENEKLQIQVPRLCGELTHGSVVVASGVAYGHIPRRLTLPVGAYATVDLEQGSFTFSPP